MLIEKTENLQNRRGNFWLEQDARNELSALLLEFVVTLCKRCGLKTDELKLVDYLVSEKSVKCRFDCGSVFNYYVSCVLQRLRVEGVI